MMHDNVESFKFGFREFFRVVVPGTCILLVLSPVVSRPIFDLGLLSQDVYGALRDPVLASAVAGVMGFLWFSIQIPKRLRRYRAYVSHLRRFMVSLGGNDGGPLLVDKPFYDFYLSCVLPATARMRIHYFASMYYMLADVGTILVIAGVLNGFAALVVVGERGLSQEIVGALYLPVAVLGVGVFTLRSSYRFLRDVMVFSLFCLVHHRQEVMVMIRGSAGYFGLLEDIAGPDVNRVVEFCASDRGSETAALSKTD